MLMWNLCQNLQEYPCFQIEKLPVQALLFPEPSELMSHVPFYHTQIVFLTFVVFLLCHAVFVNGRMGNKLQSHFEVLGT